MILSQAQWHSMSPFCIVSEVRTASYVACGSCNSLVACAYQWSISKCHFPCNTPSLPARTLMKLSTAVYLNHHANWEALSKKGPYHHNSNTTWRIIDENQRCHLFSFWLLAHETSSRRRTALLLNRLQAPGTHSLIWFPRMRHCYWLSHFKGILDYSTGMCQMTCLDRRVCCVTPMSISIKTIHWTPKFIGQLCSTCEHWAKRRRATRWMNTRIPTKNEG